MPYTYDSPPDYVKKLPKPAQKLCVDAFNSEFDRSGDEEQARMACWGAVKTQYEKVGDDDWKRKAKEFRMVDLTSIDTLHTAYALHNKIHGSYVDARWGAQRKADIQSDHEAVVRKILELGGRHIPKGDSLDDTLPQELREHVRLRYFADVAVPTDAEGPPISLVQVLRTGLFYHPIYGKFSITDETLSTMLRNFKEIRPKPPTELVVDWEHLSSEPSDKGKAAGWVKDLVKEDGCLFASVEWTDEAAAQIRTKAYRYISPEFDFNYRDKDTGKRVGPTLLAVALTNHPFIEGMEPVVLSSELSAMLFSEGGDFAEANDLTKDNSGGQFAEWTAAYINDLPDSSFAYIKSGGEKDEDGKTAPRSLRYLPYKDKDGKVDVSHLRNALSRLPQTDLSPEEQAEARRALISAAQDAGVGDYSEADKNILKEVLKELMDDKQLRETLNLGDSDDVVQAVERLKVDAAEVPT